MSFDLVLYRPADRPALTLEEASAVLESMAHFQRQTVKPDIADFLYQNPTTEVYCIFSWSPDSEPTPDVFPPGPAIDFNINYLRPTFFALECMPLVVEVAQRLALSVHNPQWEEGPEPEWTRDSLIESWVASNTWAVNGFRSRPGGSGSKPAYCPIERTTYFWSYTLAKDSIQQSLGDEDVFVPRVVFMGRPGRGEARLVSTWATFLATVFPEVDVVCAGRWRRRFLGLGPRRYDAWMVEFSRVKEVLGEALVRVDGDVPYYVYRGGPLSPDAERALGPSAGESFSLYEGLHYEDVVDVEV